MKERKLVALVIYGAVILCTAFNGYVAVHGRTTTGRRLDGRLVTWAAISALLGAALLVMALAN